MSATVRFPDGFRAGYDESAARHMQVGDVVAVPVEDDNTGYRSARIGTVTRRVWSGPDIELYLTDPAPPTIERPGE